MQVYHCKPRLSIMLFKCTFGEQYTTLKLGLLSTLDALRSITASKSLPKLLTVILSMGNFVNAQSSHQVIGFRVTFLEKVVDAFTERSMRICHADPCPTQILEVKAVNGGPTPLQVLAKLGKTSIPALLKVIDDLHALRHINTGQMATFDQELHEMKAGQRLLAGELRHAQQPNQPYQSGSLFSPELDGLFLEKLEVLHRDVSAKVSFLETEMSSLNREVRATLRYFGEPDDTKMTAEEVITILAKFLKRFETAAQGVEKMMAASKETKRPQSSKATAHSDSEPAGAGKLGGGDGHGDPVSSGRGQGAKADHAESSTPIGHMDSLLDRLKARPALNIKDVAKRPKRREVGEVPRLRLSITTSPETSLQSGMLGLGSLTSDPETVNVADSDKKDDQERASPSLAAAELGRKKAAVRNTGAQNGGHATNVRRKSIRRDLGETALNLLGALESSSFSSSSTLEETPKSSSIAFAEAIMAGLN
nr:Dishevelled associated activator of morphogenesis 2 [Polyrhizophydium stewartii]